MNDINKGLEKEAGLCCFYFKVFQKVSLQSCARVHGSFRMRSSSIWTRKFSLSHSGQGQQPLKYLCSRFVINLSSRLHKIPKPVTLLNWLSSPFLLCGLLEHQITSQPPQSMCVILMSASCFPCSLNQECPSLLLTPAFPQSNICLLISAYNLTS